HGTHCAGIICAHGDNVIGVTGVCWRAQLMVIRGFNLTRAINYILEEKNNHNVNVKVVSYSAGISTDREVRKGVSLPHANNLLNNHQNYLTRQLERLNGNDTLFVCSAGNDGKNADGASYIHLPHNCTNDNIIAVAASDNQDRLASFSNWGNKSVDIVAPGENILSLAMHGRYVYNDSNGDNKVSAGEKRLSSGVKAIYPAGSTVRAGDGDRGCRLVNFTTNETHDGTDNVYNTGEHIYRDVDGDNNVSAKDVRLTHVYINGILRYHQRSIVAANDTDNGTTLRSFAANERHQDKKGGRARYYDLGEYIYRDNDNDRRVSENDIRLTDVKSYFRNNTDVQDGGSDVGDCLHSFAPNEKFDDWIINNTRYDSGEFIYIDRDKNNTVSQGDQRLTWVRYTTKKYPPGSFVRAGDKDIGSNLTNFTHNEKYSLVTYKSGTSMATPMVTGAVAHFWTLFPWLNHTGVNSVKYWILRKTDPRPGLADSVVAGEKHNGNFNDGRLRMISGFDFGDAPDPFIATPHKYPTKQDNSQCIGAAHEDIGEEWLGNDTSPEFDADVEFPYDADPDQRPNILPKRKINN
ncbi:S8 family serine peptidase, partial [bacterium]|nr:S8 family serine peptidase [bacterium]